MPLLTLMPVGGLDMDKPTSYPHERDLRVQVVRTALNATGWTRCIDHCGRVGRESRHGNPPCRTESTSSSESYRSVSLGQELSVSNVSGSIPGMCVFRQCSNPSDDLCRSYPPRSAEEIEALAIGSDPTEQQHREYRHQIFLLRPVSRDSLLESPRIQILR